MILDAAAHGHLGLDQRFLRSLLDRRAETVPALVLFGARDRSDDTVNLAPELLALFRYWKAPEGVPFLVQFIREDPEHVPDEAVEALVEIGVPALDPLIDLYKMLDESEGGEVAFILANLGVRDERILQGLTDRLEFDLSDTLLLLSMYGDPAAIPAIQSAIEDLEESDAELRREATEVITTLSAKPGETHEAGSREPFDIYATYPDTGTPSRASVPIERLMSRPVSSSARETSVM